MVTSQQAPRNPDSPPHPAHAQAREADHSRRRVPSVRIVLLALVAGLMVASAVGYLLRDQIYDPAHSYGTESPHVVPPAEKVPASP
jgi:hypothetical protein